MPADEGRAPTKVRLCRHCKRNLQRRPFGLCWSCYGNKSIHRLYAKGDTSRYARHGHGAGNHIAPLPEPTTALPGTEAKLRVLEERAARGEQLFHPLDATWSMMDLIPHPMGAQTLMDYG